ncbi:hypothetical protein [Aquabacterium sp. OR-4]|uniref:hypothetical protein n=1 Tax=Aquabacterium sp. OR-4 TaxID=2978127 RepID=UPI0021B35A58|nr:hypothetical protein [Aquabacterium sp. OR-4]MDT7834518.1 hypothetical protein [Aquabacterium sp. OR-4]
MRAAPAVEAPLADGRTERAAIVLLHLIAAGALIAWAATWRSAWQAQLSGPDAGRWWPALAAAAWLLGAAWLGRWQACRCLPGTAQGLGWTGQYWTCLMSGVPAQASTPLPVHRLASVAVQLDLGPWLLLRLRPLAAHPPVCWAVARRAAAGSHWHGLRVALQHHAVLQPVPEGRVGPGLL